MGDVVLVGPGFQPCRPDRTCCVKGQAREPHAVPCSQFGTWPLSCPAPGSWDPPGTGTWCTFAGLCPLPPGWVTPSQHQSPRLAQGLPGFLGDSWQQVLWVCGGPLSSALCHWPAQPHSCGLPWHAQHLAKCPPGIGQTHPALVLLKSGTWQASLRR